MPIIRVGKGDQPADALAGAVADLETNGHRVMQVTSWSNEWLLLVDDGARRPGRTATPPRGGETRAATRKGRRS